MKRALLCSAILLVTLPAAAQRIGTAERIRQGFGAPASAQCSGQADVGKVYARNDAKNVYTCLPDGLGGFAWLDYSAAGGTGLTSLNGQTGSTQTFANDTNVTISSVTNTHTLGWSGQLSVARGGTGAGTFTASGVLLGNTTSAIQVTAAGAANQVFRVPGAGGAPAFGAVDLSQPAAITGTLPLGNGGTGQASFGAGLLRSSGSALSSTELSGVVVTSTSNVSTPGKVDVMQTSWYCQDAGISDTYACNLSPAATAYVTGTSYRFKANTANTGAASVNFNALGALTIVKVQGGITTTLADNDIRAGQWVTCSYDGINCQMTSELGNAAAGSGTINAGATNVLPKYTATTTLDDSLLSDDGTTLSYAGTGGIKSAGTGAGQTLLCEPTATGTDCVTLSAPASVTTAYTLTYPAAVSLGFVRADATGTLTFEGETGTGSVVRATSPTITTPTISGAIVLPDNTRQTFNPGANASGFNAGAHTADPDTLVNGDLWYNSTDNVIRARINGSSVALGAGGSGCTTSGSNNQVLTDNGAGGCVSEANLTFDGTVLAVPQITPTATINFPDNVRQTFNPGTNAAGLNVGVIAGDPNTLSNGDMWYDSTANELTARVNGASVALGAGGGNPTAGTAIAVSGSEVSVDFNANRKVAIMLTNGGNGHISIGDLLVTQIACAYAAPTDTNPSTMNCTTGAGIGDNQYIKTLNDSWRHDRTAAQQRDINFGYTGAWPDVTSLSLFVGITDQDNETMANNNTSNPAGNYAGFNKVSTETTFFCVVKDGTTQTRVDSAVTVTAGQMYRLEVLLDDSVPNATFRINGSAVCSSPITTNLPTDGTNMRAVSTIETQAAATRSIHFLRMQMSEIVNIP